MKIGERVIVSACVTGDGEHHKGWIVDIYEFMRETFVEVKFDSPCADGRLGCIVNNLGMIRKENQRFRIFVLRMNSCIFATDI